MFFMTRFNKKTFTFYFVSSIAQIFFTFYYYIHFISILLLNNFEQTEVVQIAILETLILHDTFDFLTIIGIIISTIGVLVFSTKNKDMIIKTYHPNQPWWDWLVVFARL